ncbi:MG2 domain-containing protein, partial [Escherichia coli]|uniref:MG2 domain-containing protein n=1 Tax=Escherichia coli TaxID=562 RepID=UPI003EE304A8
YAPAVMPRFYHFPAAHAPEHHWLPESESALSHLIKRLVFLAGPRDLYRPGETVILNGLLRDADGKALPDQPIKLDVIKPDGQV